MPIYPGSFGQGFMSGMNDALDNDQRRSRGALEISALEAANKDRARQAAALPMVGQALAAIYGQPDQQGGVTMPPTEDDQAMGQGAMTAPNPVITNPPPYKAMPAPGVKGMPQQSDADVVASAQGQVMPQVDVVAPPPKAAPAAATTMPKLDLGSIVRTLKAQGVTDEMIPVALDHLKPIMTLENQHELKLSQLQMSLDRQRDLQLWRQSKDDLQRDLANQKDSFAREKLDAQTKSRAESLAQRKAWQDGQLEQMMARTARLSSDSNRKAIAENPQVKALMQKVKTLNAQIGQGLNYVANSTDKAQQAAMSDRVAAQQQELDEALRAIDGQVGDLLEVNMPATTPTVNAKKPAASPSGGTGWGPVQRVK